MIENLVDIPMCTYNHEPFIAQAIEGVISQKTNFKFRLFIGDDCSTDNTRSIIQSYAEKYSQIVYPIFHPENLGPTNNSIHLISLCTSNYIALCDGDDYWTDPFKLQKQVDTLESQKIYGLCFTGVQHVDRDNKYLKECLHYKDIISIDDYIHQGLPFINTCTWLIRNDVLKAMSTQFSQIGDLELASHILNQGYQIKFLPQNTASYRVLEQSASHFKTIKDEVNFFYDQVRVIERYGTSSDIIQSFKKRFYSKYFQHLPYLHLNLSERFNICRHLSHQKSKWRLFRYLFLGTN